MDICGEFGCIFEPKLLTFALTLPAFGLSRPGPVHRLWRNAVLHGWGLSLLLALFFFRLDDFLLAKSMEIFVFPALALHVLLHELSHAMTACTHGIQTEGFMIGILHLFPVGGTVLPELCHAPASVRLQVTAAGPLSNLMAASLACVAAHFGFCRDFMTAFALVGFPLAILNCLPLPHLDGAELHAVFSKPQKLYPRALFFALTFGAAAGILLACLPFSLAWVLAFFGCGILCTVLPLQSFDFGAHTFGFCCALLLACNKLSSYLGYIGIVGFGFCLLLAVWFPLALELFFSGLVFLQGKSTPKRKSIKIKQE